MLKGWQHTALVNQLLEIAVLALKLKLMNFLYPSQAMVKQNIWAIWTIYLLRADFSEYMVWNQEVSRFSNFSC